jgi:hypothetical protein
MTVASTQFIETRDRTTHKRIGVSVHDRAHKTLTIIYLPSPRAMEVYFADSNPVKRRGELMLMNCRNHVDKSAVEAGKRAAFIVVAALALTPPLQSQQSAQQSPMDPLTIALDAGPLSVPSSSPENPDPGQTAPAPSGQSPVPNSDHTLTGNFPHRLAQFYSQDWAGTNPAEPSVTKRGLPARP